MDPRHNISRAKENHLNRVIILSTLHRYGFPARPVRAIRFRIAGKHLVFLSPRLCSIGRILNFGVLVCALHFFAQLILNPFGFEWLKHAFLALTTAGGAPLGAALAARALGLTQNLSNLNGVRLLLISLFAGLFNALAIRLTLSLKGVPEEVLPDMLSIMIGDTIGAWTIIYLIKITLTWRGRAARHF